MTFVVIRKLITITNLHVNAFFIPSKDVLNAVPLFKSTLRKHTSLKLLFIYAFYKFYAAYVVAFINVS